MKSSKLKFGWKPQLPPFRAFKKKVYLANAKTSQFIYQLGEGNFIRSFSEDIPLSEIKSVATKQKIEYLKKCFLKYRQITGMGRGIAAVQVGIMERFALIYLPASATPRRWQAGLPNRKEQMMIIINPKILKKSKKLYRRFEACMSEGPVSAPVVRPAWIEFEYYDENGAKCYWDVKDVDDSTRLYNRVFQHEIDHMAGVIFLDKAELKFLTLESDPEFYKNTKFEEVTNEKNK